MKNTIKIIYVDDSEINIIKFSQIVEDFEELEVENTFNNADDALEYCAATKPDLAILDIEMPGNNGLWLGDKLKELNVPFAFLTSHEGYAIKAFNAFALHYILKPVTALSIRELINRYEKVYNVPETGTVKSPLTIEAKSAPMPPQRIFVNTQKQILVLQLDEINYIEAEGSYTNFNLIDGRQVVSGKNMKFYSDIILENPNMVKVHRSYIINQAQLEAINKKKTELVFIFKNKREISMASFRRDEWMDKFM